MPLVITRKISQPPCETTGMCAPPILHLSKDTWGGGRIRNECPETVRYGPEELVASEDLESCYGKAMGHPVMIYHPLHNRMAYSRKVS